MDIRNIGGGKVRIGVDAGCLGIKDDGLKVGVYNIVKNSLIALGKIDKKNTYLLYSFYPIDYSLLKEFGGTMKNIVVRPSRGWMKIWLPLRLLFDRVDIFLGANQAVPLRLPGSRYKTLGVVYDIAFEKYPELYNYASSVGKHIFYSRETAKKSDKIIAISLKTKEDLMEVYKTPEQKITVAYPGIVELPKVKPFISESPYFLYVGALKKGKNIATLIKAYGEFRTISKERVQLFLAGGNTWLDPEIIEVLNQIPKAFRSDIYLLGAITDAKKLAAFYRGAEAFVCPSLYEGFGLPFAEAMSVGCPIIGSTRGSIPEVVGGAGLLFDPYDIKGLAKAMKKVATNKNVQQKLSQKGITQSKRYSFKTFAKAIYSAIESLS